MTVVQFSRGRWYLGPTHVCVKRKTHCISDKICLPVKYFSLYRQSAIFSTLSQPSRKIRSEKKTEETRWEGTEVKRETFYGMRMRINESELSNLLKDSSNSSLITLQFNSLFYFINVSFYFSNLVTNKSHRVNTYLIAICS